MRALILRDARESPKKCSVAGLRGAPGIEIRTWRRGEPFDASGCLLLHHEGPPLTRADRGHPLLFLDCSWRHVHVLLCDVRGEFALRSIPGSVRTAYPRRSKLFDDPASGLATLEALYVASLVLGEPRDDLLASYRPASSFLSVNREVFDELRRFWMRDVPNAPARA